MQEYIPGACNIGPAEIARRKRAGWTGLAATAVLWVLLIFFDVPTLWRLTLFIPATMAATGFLQAYFHFCAGFGFKGVYNLVKPAGQTETIQQKEFRRKDRQKALQITGLSALIGALVALVAYSFPI